jgi:hypothetical protein
MEWFKELSTFLSALAAISNPICAAATSISETDSAADAVRPAGRPAGRQPKPGWGEEEGNEKEKEEVRKIALQAEMARDGPFDIGGRAKTAGAIGRRRAAL